MKLLLINPNTTESMTSDMVQRACGVAASGTQVMGKTITTSVSAINGYADEAIADAALVKYIQSLELDYDGMVIGCYSDPGLYALRELTDIPTVGIAEASMYAAMAIGHRFGIITTTEQGIPGTRDLLRRYGLEGRCAGIAATGLDVLQLDDAPRARSALRAAGVEALKSGAEVLCLGCASMSPQREYLEAELNVPVVSGVESAVVFCELLVRLRLKTSKSGAFKKQ